MDDQSRIAMVDIPVIIPSSSEERHQVTRFIYGNHLGSSSLELNENAVTISYEEYHPYGTTSFSATNTAIKAASKSYRFTGMERDEETGMAYHSARYYLPWLGRWLSSDPIGIGDGINIYTYVKNTPVIFMDQKGLGIADWIRDRVIETALPIAPVMREVYQALPEEQQVEFENTMMSYHRDINQAVSIVTSVLEVVVGCPLAETGIGAAACLDGIDNLSSAVTSEPTLKSRAISGVAQLGGASSEQGDQIGETFAPFVSMAVGLGAGISDTPRKLRAPKQRKVKIQDTIKPVVIERVPIETPLVKANSDALSTQPLTPPRTCNPLANGPDYGPNPRNLPPRDPITGEREFDVWPGGLVRERVYPGATRDGITKSMRRRMQLRGRKIGTIDGPPTNGPVVVGHVEGQAHVLTPEGGSAMVAPQTASGNSAWSAPEKAYADRVRAHNAANPEDVRPVRPRGQQRR